MVKIVTNFENGVQIEEAPNSLRTIAPYVDVSLYGLTASGVAFYEISFVRKMYGDIVKKVIPTSLLLSNRELICFLVSNGYANVPLKEDEKILENCRNNFKKLEDGDPYCVELWKKFREVSLKEFQKV